MQSLLLYNKFLKNVLYRYYPFNANHIDLYSKIDNWSSLSINPNINWQQINWQAYLTMFVTCPPHLQEVVEDNCIECSDNPTFPWCEQLIEYYNRDLNWCYLAQNRHFLSNRQLVTKYSSYLAEYRELIQETLAITNLQPKISLSMVAVTLQDVFIKRGLYVPYFGKLLTCDIIKTEEQNIHWDKLSSYPLVDWTEELLSAYYHKLDKRAVLRNNRFTCTLPLLQALQPTEADLIAAQAKVWEGLKEYFTDETVESILQQQG